MSQQIEQIFSKNKKTFVGREEEIKKYLMKYYEKIFLRQKVLKVERIDASERIAKSGFSKNLSSWRNIYQNVIVSNCFMDSGEKRRYDYKFHFTKEILDETTIQRMEDGLKECDSLNFNFNFDDALEKIDDMLESIRKKKDDVFNKILTAKRTEILAAKNKYDRDLERLKKLEEKIEIDMKYDDLKAIIADCEKIIPLAKSLKRRDLVKKYSDLLEKTKKKIEDQIAAEKKLSQKEQKALAERRALEKQKALEEKQALKEKRETEKVEALGVKKTLEAQKASAKAKTQAEKKVLKEQKALAKQKALEEKKANKELDKQKALEEKKILDEQKELERLKALEEQKVLDEQKALDDQKTAEEQKVLDEQKELERQKALEEQKLLDEQKEIERQKALEEKKMLDEQKALEKQKALEEKQALKEQKALDKQKALEEKKAKKEIEKQKALEEKKLRDEQRALDRQKALEEKQALKAQATIEKQKTREEKLALKALDKGDTRKKQIACILGGILIISSAIAYILLLFTMIYSNIAITPGASGSTSVAETADTFFIFFYVNGCICLIGGVLVILGAFDLQKPLIIFGIVIDIIGAVMFLLVAFWAASLCGAFMVTIITLACLFFGINMLGVVLSYYSQKNLEVSKGVPLKAKVPLNVYDEYET